MLDSGIFGSDRFSNGRIPEDPSMVSLLSTHCTSSTGSMATCLVEKLDGQKISQASPHRITLTSPIFLFSRWRLGDREQCEATTAVMHSVSRNVLKLTVQKVGLSHMIGKCTPGEQTALTCAAASSVALSFLAAHTWNWSLCDTHPAPREPRTSQALQDQALQ